MTNGERIRAMSDEELVEVIMCPYIDKDVHVDCVGRSCIGCCLEWIKQEEA